MPKVVTIEGSLTDSVMLRRGQRRTVQLTPRVQRLIQRGFVKVIDVKVYDDPVPAASEPPVLPDPRTDTEREADEQAALARAENGVPERTATRKEWVAFLRGRGIDIPVNDDGKEPTRDGLVALWQQVSGGG